MRQEELQHTLEELIDANTVSDLLEAIATVCSEKASHILTSYDDKILAKEWEKTGELVNKVANEVIL